MSLVLELPQDVDSDSLLQLIPDLNPKAPSNDSIISLYRLILGQATDLAIVHRELEDANSLAVKRDVELDQALQDKERVTQDLEHKLEASQSEAKRLQSEKGKLAESQTKLRDEISKISSSHTSSSTELTELKRRLEDTEREKRDLIGVVSRLTDETTQREEEIQSLRTSLRESRKEFQNLESQVRELRSSDATTKFKLDSMSQQLELAQAEVARVNEELTSKSDEFTKYRRAKQAEITALQNQLDAHIQSESSVQTSLSALQSAHSAQTAQLTQALARVQDLSSQLAEQEATYSSEATVLRRLVSAMEEREKQAQDVVQGIERQWAEVAEKADRREAMLKDEIEHERRGREEAEKQLQTMGTVMEKVDRGELPIPDPTLHGMMGLSPTVAMASCAQKSGKTFTEVYADYVRLQEDYAKKSSEYDHMDRTLAAVLAQIEERAPILSQQRLEYERLQSEAAQLATQLSQALTERDAQATLAQESSQKLNRTSKENEVLQQQLEDLGRQVQTLLKEIGRRDDPSIPPDEELEVIAPSDNVEAVITNNLVLFRSISGLQEQNMRLLRITRELGQKMESEERDYRETMEREQGEAVREAHEAMQELAAQLENQKKSSDTIIRAYMKERDTFKAMLARSGNQAVPAEAGGQLVLAGAAATAGSSDVAKELTEIQSQFDAYRAEMGVDTNRLREDLLKSQRETSALSSNLAKSQARCEYLQERLRMSQDQAAINQRELEELGKRNSQLFDQWTRLDIECSRVSEDLQACNGMAERLRNECANLRAEKKIWETVQGRLMEENKTLALERSHLSDLMTNVQKMHTDLERSGENDRRRLESQLQLLENQTQDLRTQLSQERDSSRHVSLQKEIELKELQTRLDRANQDLSKTREALVGAETSKKHLEERVSDLTRHLQGNEEKLAVYERRPVGSQSSGQDLSHDQQLEAEVAELRAKLKVAEVDLAAARRNVEQFQAISKASEEALASFHQTSDEYKATTEAQLVRLESECQSLKTRLDASLQEISQFNTKYDELQKTLESERATWMADRKTLEDTIVDLSMSEKTNQSDRATRETEIRQQEELVKAVEQRYSNEVVAHAEALKMIEGLKKQLYTAQTSARENSTAAETAKSKLHSSEASWQHQRESLDKEIANLNSRCRDLTTQNTLLHEHLETVSSQAARIKQVAEASPTTDPEDASAGGDSSDLHQVIKYLRRDKEINELQLESSKQEAARLKVQVDHLSRSLDETRIALSEERERAAGAAASETQHAELLERINQLNILRESNATLRTDLERQSKKSQKLEAELQQLTSQLEPLKEQARTVKAELDARNAQVKRLEDESRRWQERNTQLLSKYDRIDPAEVQALKDEIEKLKHTNTAGEQQRAALTEKLAKTETTVTGLRGVHQQNKAKFDGMKEERLALQTKIQELEAANASLQTEKSELFAAKAAADAEKPALAVDTTIAALEQERDKLLEEKATWIASSSTVGSAPASDEGRKAWEEERTALVQARDAALAEVKTITQKVQKLESEVKAQKLAAGKFQSRIADMQKARAAEAEKVQAQIDAAVDKAKSEMQAVGSLPSVDPTKLGEELKDLEARLAAKHAEELKAAVEGARKAATTAELQPDIATALAKQEEEFKKKIEEAKEEGLEAGRKEHALKTNIKDGQLVRAQQSLTALEKQVKAWRDQGLIPAAPPSASTGPTSAKAAPAAVTSTPATSTSAATASAAPPSTATPASASTSAAPRGAGRGRVVPRGTATGRGGLPIRGRGAAPAGSAPQQVSIIGAAAKRPREEGTDGPAEGTAKRIKPEAPKTGGGPIAIKRPTPSS